MSELSTQPIRQRQTTLDNISWTPIYVSAHSRAVVLRNKGTDVIHFRTDSANSATEDDLYPGQSKEINGYAAPNIPIGYAKTDGSTGPLLVDELVPR
jgi:hypothetical protein